MEDDNHTPIISADQQRNQAVPFLCQHCSRSFTSQQALSLHITRQHPEVTKKPHQCQACQKVFYSAYTLKRHSAQAHSKDRPYDCPKCVFHCKTESVFKSHLKIHDQNNGAFKCSICNKEYVSNSGVNNHLKTAHDSLSTDAHTETGNSQDNGDKEKCQGETSEEIAEAAPGNYLIDVSNSFENGIGRVDYPTPTLQTWTEPTENAPPLARWVSYSGSNYFLHEDFEKHCVDENKWDDAIKEAVTATEYAHGESSQGVLLSFVSTQNGLFTSSNPTLGPSNGQREASSGIKEANENISIAVSQGVRNGLATVDHHLSTEASWTEWKTNENGFPFGEWGCHCGNMYASEDDLHRHWNEAHKPNDRID